MPRKTLDELFRSGPPRRDSGDSRDELNEVEKQFVLWGLKEEWKLSRIAEALGVDGSAVRQFRIDLVSNPGVLLDLDVVEPIEDQGVTMFRCVGCTVHLNSPDQIDRHALAHFLKDSDLDSAIAARQRSNRQRLQSWSDQPEADGLGESQAETDQSPDSSQTENGENDVPSVVPPDADRSELLQALRRIAALPEEPESPDEPSVNADADAEKSPKQESQPPHIEGVDTFDVHNAFERMAERRGLSEDTAESSAKPHFEVYSQGEAAESRHDASSSNVDSTENTEPDFIEGHSEHASGVEVSEDGRRSKRKRGFLSRWARSANAERQRRDVVGGMGSVKEATSVTIESGVMKILSTRMLDVVDYRAVPLSPQLYAGGVVVDAGTISRHLAAALADMEGAHRAVYAAVPGYQSAMRRFDLPDVREIDPKEVIPREARRALGIPVENATLRWQRLPGRSRIARWLVAAASETSYSAISSVIRGTGHKMRALELRPFPLTRAIGHPTVIGVSVSSDGCDVVVVRQWEPHTYQSVYWEAGSVSDSSDLVRRLTEVVENTIDLHNLHNPEVSLTPDVPMALTGGEAEHHADLGMFVASNVGRELVEGKNPLNAPGDFPYQSMVVNVGLALWDI
ncbi:MAG: hypothetical protein OXI33_02865 [Chloroflexota bacterium]|nr:hypothetical protein [Chloroflexota bacterium]